jgi:hypothetical protein
MRQKRIQFTKREIDNLMGLIAIAGSGVGEEDTGDYTGMSDADWKAIATAREKLAELYRRKQQAKEQQAND